MSLQTFIAFHTDLLHFQLQIYYTSAQTIQYCQGSKLPLKFAYLFDEIQKNLGRHDHTNKQYKKYERFEMANNLWTGDGRMQIHRNKCRLMQSSGKT